MKVLVTGAAGQLGRVVARVLADAGLSVRATDRVLRPNLAVKPELDDLLDPLASYRLCQGMDAVVHLANHPWAHPDQEQRVFNENVSVNCNVFEAARQAGVRKIVFASSIHVMIGHLWRRREGPMTDLPYLPADAGYPARPGNVYGLSKHVTETMLAYYAGEYWIGAVALRFPGLIDDDEVARYRRWAHHPGAVRHRSGELFVHLLMSDAASLVLAVLNADLPGYRVYFPGAQDVLISKPVAELVAAHFPGVPLRKPAHELTSLVDISRITHETGWRPKPTPGAPGVPTTAAAAGA